ncbi:MAG: fructose-bisphosphatase class III, partial [Pygmaiobacter massiliensis]|nr:fructose-bisphosphatase class III [Pygmaiobacter massiliensis]
NRERRLIEDTDEGQAIRRQITELQRLLAAYRAGIIKENNKQ